MNDVAADVETSGSLKRILIAIAIIQGLALFALYRAEVFDYWPSDSPTIFFPLWTFAIIWPVMLLLSMRDGNEKLVVQYAFGFSLLLAMLGAYIGSQTIPSENYDVPVLVSTFAISVLIATFKALMYLQQRANGVALSYQVLFSYSWRNFLVTGFSLLFVIAFGLILLLWGQLFSIIGVDFFKYLFKQDWFLFPVFGFALGLGVVIFRELTGVIDGVSRLLQGMFKLLLPLVAGIAMVFICTLPFVGIEKLWSTGYGTNLLLWLMALELFLANAVYQDGRGDTSYSPGVHRFIYVGMLSLPFLSAISFYGLYLRIDQYGISVSRFYGMLVWLLLSLFSIGYVWGILSKRDKWTLVLSQTNILMGWFLVLLMLVTNSPLLDPRKLTVSSQISRLASGKISFEDFDVRYLRYELANPGYLATEALKETYRDSHPEFVERLEKVNRFDSGKKLSAEDFWARVVTYPVDLEIVPDVKQAMTQNGWNYMHWDVVITVADLNGDGTDEYLMLASNNQRFGFAQYYIKLDGQWRMGRLEPDHYEISAAEITIALANGELRTVEPLLNEVLVGGHRLRPTTTTNIIQLMSSDTN